MEIPRLKKGKGDIFIPGCITDPNGIIECNPKLVKKDITLESTHPIRMKKVEVDGKPAMEILDDGGSSAELLDQVRRHVAKRHL